MWPGCPRWHRAFSFEVGSASLKDYAERIGREYNTLKNYRGVARAFPSGDRSPRLSFIHHLRVMTVKDPDKRQGWLQWAAENNKSVTRDGPESTVQPPNPTEQHCGRWAVRHRGHWDRKGVIAMQVPGGVGPAGRCPLEREPNLKRPQGWL